jgi:uncharacterized membrane protein YhaH (DUF805 family)
MNEILSTQCWRCRAHIEFSPVMRGQRVKCPSCGTKQAMPLGLEKSSLHLYQPPSQSYAQLLFSYNGRISRRTLWLKFQLPLGGMAILATILDEMGLYNESGNINILFGLIHLLFGLFALAFLYPYIAALIKRCHDRNHSGLFLLIFLIPLLNIWPWIELYFLKGTSGRNEYGEEPVS